MVERPLERNTLRSLFSNEANGNLSIICTRQSPESLLITDSDVFDLLGKCSSVTAYIDSWTYD